MWISVDVDNFRLSNGKIFKRCIREIIFSAFSCLFTCSVWISATGGAVSSQFVLILKTSLIFGKKFVNPDCVKTKIEKLSENCKIAQKCYLKDPRKKKS